MRRLTYRPQYLGTEELRPIWAYTTHTHTIYHRCIQATETKESYDNTPCIYCGQPVAPFVLLAAKLDMSTA